MSSSLKNLWNDYGIAGLLFVIVVLYGLYMLFNNLNAKGSYGNESMAQDRKKAYSDSSSPMGPQPAQESGNEVYSSVGSSMQTSGQGVPSSCNSANSSNPSDLLPKDTNSQWAQLNPAGKGDLANINLLKAGYHIGIDTVGQSLRNANLQIRSEPPNPQLSVGPWNNSTIEPDFMRIPLELGSGAQ
jgi:hypothetical protein